MAAPEPVRKPVAEEPAESAEDIQAQREEQARLDKEAQDKMMEIIHQKEQAASQRLEQAKIQAEIIQQEAKAKAEKMVLDAKAESTDIQEAARKTGYEMGLEEGRKDGEAQVKEELHHLLVEGNARAEKTLQEARIACEDYVVAAENTIGEMVLKIADKVIPQHFIDMPQLILPLVKEAVRKVKDQPHVLVRVPSEAYELCMLAQTELQQILEGSATLEIKADDALGAGDCMVESPNGVVDARLSTQLELVQQAVRNVMK